MENQTENFEQKASGYGWYALAVLTTVYVLNFLDRVVILYLFPLIKTEYSFTDLQLSLLGTTAFTIFYTALGIPFGRFADRGSRTKLIAFGLATWSLFSGLTGFADGFWSLFFCRLMVGIGEATLGPAAISLLSDYFPAKQRATVTSIYSMGIALGAGLAAFFAGWIGQTYGWRWAFYLLGFPGIMLAALVFLLRENPRGVSAGVQQEYSNSDWQKLFSNKAFVLLCIGYALLGLATNNLNIWGVSFYSRLHKIDLLTIGFWGGILTLVGGIPATLFGGVIADWFRRRQPGGRMLYGSLLSLISVPFWLLLIYTDNFVFMLLANLILLTAALGWLGAAAADVTEIAGINLRGLGIAVYFFSVNIAAYLIGSNLIGFLNDKLGATENPAMMRYSLLVCPVSCLLSAVCLWLGSKSLDKPALA